MSSLEAYETGLPMRILVADGDALCRCVLEQTLETWGYEVLSTDSGDGAWAALEEERPPRVAILDSTMPGLEGPEICRRVRRLDGSRYLYCLLMAPEERKQDLITGLEAGADDVLGKPIDVQELRARLERARRVLVLEGELRHHAMYDPLTTALSRRAVLDLLDRELHRGRRQKISVGLVLGDVDGLKAINQSHGHLAGDAVLREVVRRVRTCIRGYDAVGRYGGDEFLVVLPGSDLRSSTKLAERVRGCLAAESIDAGESRIHKTMCLGVTSTGGDPNVTRGTLLWAADQALSMARNGSGNRIEIEVPVMGALAEAALEYGVHTG